MISPRRTRLVRAADLRRFREALVALAVDGTPLEARDRTLIVPTRAAAAHLFRSIDARCVARGGAVVFPDATIPRDMVRHFAGRLTVDGPTLTGAEREVLLGVSCRTAREQGHEPPFRLRPGLMSEMLRFYDSLQRHQKDVGTFERLALGRLEPGAEIDRGAERLVRQTRFLAAAFREFERRTRLLGADEHRLRARVIAEPSRRPVRHVIVAVGDYAFDPHGLHVADWDLLARIPGLERLDVVVTEGTLAGALHERMHGLLPGIEEVRVEQPEPQADPALVTPPGGAVVHVARDREEEVAAFARRAKAAARAGEDLNGMALVVEKPLPYVYVAREVFRSAGVPLQMVDALPLAAEPYAAALDLVATAVSSGFARTASIALLRSPHFSFTVSPPTRADRPPDEQDVAALDRLLAESGYAGGIAALERLQIAWRGDEAPRLRVRRAIRAGETLLAIAEELRPLTMPAPVADHLTLLIDWLERHAGRPASEDPLHARGLRARGAVAGTLRALRDAYARLDPEPVVFDEVASLVRRWIEGQTFAPRTGDAGVHLVDAESARFGEFDTVQLAGVVDAEWPARPRRNIFYSPGILRDLGWPSEAERRDATRARFADLLRLPAARVLVSAFSLEADAIVGPSTLLEDVPAAGLDTVVEEPVRTRVFEHEALALDPLSLEALDGDAREWAEHRRTGPDRTSRRFRGTTGPHDAPAFSLSALERYQDCPFRFFAADVLRLEEDPEDASALSPRARGRLLHEVFQRFFEAWDARGGGTITAFNLDEARALCARVAEPLLSRLPEADAALERARLFGSAISVGALERVLGLEAVHPVELRARLLEHRVDGEFSLGSADGRRAPLRGIADRIDLLPDRRLRVIDYKSGAAPDPKRALQVPIYALCAQEQLQARDGGAPWTIAEASYVTLSGRRTHVPVVKSGAPDAAGALTAARSRLWSALDGIRRGEFPPRPHDPAICRTCAFDSVCRKDYVEHD
jgi:RecB family exonuclease